MKKIIFSLAITVFTITAVQAQKTIKSATITDSSQVKIKAVTQTPGKIIKPLTAQTKTTPPPPTNSNSNSTTQNASIYSLTSVRVNIRTGNDNKEFPSKVDFLLLNRGNTYIFKQLGENMRNEMKSNSNTEFGLVKYAGINPQHITLTSIQNEGLSLRIFYSPNFILDAWKIEGVTMTLEFKDQNGNLHPTLGSKTIVFNNASGFLDAANHILMCSTDGQLTPTTSSIQQ